MTSATLPSFFSNTLLGFQPSNPRPKLTLISTLKTPLTLLSHSSGLFSSRFHKVEHLQLRKDRCTVFANPAEGDIVEKKSEGSETSNTQGPPVLTILAGLVVFSLFVWIVGSIVMWLVGLIVNGPYSK